jgi:hypothetical protein
LTAPFQLEGAQYPEMRTTVTVRFTVLVATLSGILLINQPVAEGFGDSFSLMDLEFCVDVLQVKAIVLGDATRPRRS